MVKFVWQISYHPANGASLGSYWVKNYLSEGSLGQAFRPSILNKNVLFWKLNKFYFKLEQYILVQYWGMCEQAFSKKGKNGLTKIALAAKLANLSWNGFFVTEKLTDKFFDTINGGLDFFFQLNFLPPYPLRFARINKNSSFHKNEHGL